MLGLPKLAFEIGRRINGNLAGSSTAPQRPTDLEYTQTGLTGNGTLITWQDNSDDEIAFVLQVSVQGGPFQGLATLPPDTTAFGPTSLGGPASHYAYRIAALGRSKRSVWSDTLSVGPKYAPLLSVQSNEPRTRITLSWETPDMFDTVTVYRSTDNVAFEAIDTVAVSSASYNDDTVTDETATYFYKIRLSLSNDAMHLSPESNVAISEPQTLSGGEGGGAIGGEGGGVIGGEGGTTVGEEAGELLAPSNLRAVIDGATTVLTWDDFNTNPFTSFKVYRSVEGGAFAVIATVDADVLTYTVNSDADDDYYVTAFGDSESAPSETAYVTNYSAVADLAANRDSNTAATLTWSSDDYYDRVQIFRTNTTDNEDPVALAIASGWVFQYQDTTLNALKEYDYTIRHFKEGDPMHPSAESNTAHADLF